MSYMRNRLWAAYAGVYAMLYVRDGCLLCAYVRCYVRMRATQGMMTMYVRRIVLRICVYATLVCMHRVCMYAGVSCVCRCLVYGLCVCNDCMSMRCDDDAMR